MLAAVQVPVSHLSPQETLEQFLGGLLALVDPELKLSVRQGDGALEAEIQGAQAARLAGRDGRVLGAVEVLAYAALSRQGHTEVRVRIDAGGFRKRHAENLSKVAERLAVQVAKTGEPHEMQPMPPADRRVFHLALQEHPLVQTESVGEGSARHLVILPRTTPLPQGNGHDQQGAEAPGGEGLVGEGMVGEGMGVGGQQPGSVSASADQMNDDQTSADELNTDELNTDGAALSS